MDQKPADRTKTSLVWEKPLDPKQDDLSPVRRIPYGDNFWCFKREDPFGLIRISLERGELPEVLKGQTFTNYDKAKKAVEDYLENK